MSASRVVPPYINIQEINDFIDEQGGLSGCIDSMRNPLSAGVVAFQILKLILPSRIDNSKCATLASSSRCLKKLLDAFVKDNYIDFGEYVLNPSQIPDTVLETQMASKTEENIFAEPFTRPYIGSAVDMLYRTLEDLDRDFVTHTGRYYAKCLSIVQSSGAGKSRTMLQLKEKGVIVVYLNIRRPEADQNGKSYPPRDEIPARILTEDLDCSVEDYNDRCTAFFIGLFFALRDRLGDISRGDNPSEEVVKAWSRDMCDLTGKHSRSRFFTTVEKYYDMILAGIKSARSEDEGIGNKEAANQITPLSSRQTANSKKPRGRVPKTFGAASLRNAYKEMLASAATVFVKGQHAPQMVIAIDEAHSLRKPQEFFLPSDVLSRVISEVSRAQPTIPFWVITTSTTSEVAGFSAPPQFHSSARVFQSNKTLFPLYSNFGWDHHAPALKEVDPKDVSKVIYIPKFGRPLWNSMVDAGMTTNEILDAAGQKLLGGSAFIPNDLNQVLAVIGQRCLLDICLGRYDSTKLLQTAVSSHLRILLSASEDRTLLETAYPSEPLLSCAAARLLYPDGIVETYSRVDIITEALRTLKPAIQSQTVARGDEGELTSRLVFLINKDKAIRKHLSSLPSTRISLASDNLVDCSAVPVKDFVEGTFGSSKFTREIELLLDGWYINFSHWVAASKEISFEGSEREQKKAIQTWLLRHWTRTCAIQCSPLQSSFDKIIPMYNLKGLGELEAESFPDFVSFILISDRTRERSSESTLHSSWLEEANLPCLGQPYITILADLALEEQSLTLELDQTTTGPVLKIFAAGLGETTYPSLASSVITELREILRGPSMANQSDLRKDNYLADRKALNSQLRYGSTIEEASAV